jgi:hypothetical protein
LFADLLTKMMEVGSSQWIPATFCQVGLSDDVLCL